MAARIAKRERFFSSPADRRRTGAKRVAELDPAVNDIDHIFPRVGDWLVHYVAAHGIQFKIHLGNIRRLFSGRAAPLPIEP